jgi:hypothetical protein
MNAKRILKYKNWRSSAEDWDRWRRRIEDATKLGCSAVGGEEKRREEKRREEKRREEKRREE